jgi:phosphotransferase family enzyme
MTMARFPSAGEIACLLNSRVFAGRTRNGESCTVDGPVALSEQSVIYRARCPGLSGPLLIKHPHGFGASARSQYESLNLARRRLRGQARLRVPNAYCYLLDEGFLITDWFDAPTVTHLLRLPGASPSSVVAALEAAGRWLRAFHSGEAQLTRSFLNSDRLIDEIRPGTGRVIGWQGVPRRFDAFINLLEQAKQALAEMTVDVSLLHGDFKPSNVIVAADNVVVIDIIGEFEGPVVDDIAHFLLHLDLRLLEPFGWHLLPWRRKLTAAFLRGYDPDGSAVDPIVLSWARLQRALRHYRDRSKLAKSSLGALFLKLCYTRCASLNAADLRSLLAHK